MQAIQWHSTTDQFVISIAKEAMDKEVFCFVRTRLLFGQNGADAPDGEVFQDDLEGLGAFLNRGDSELELGCRVPRWLWVFPRWFWVFPLVLGARWQSLVRVSSKGGQVLPRYVSFAGLLQRRTGLPFDKNRSGRKAGYQPLPKLRARRRCRAKPPSNPPEAETTCSARKDPPLADGKRIPVPRLREDAAI